MTIIYLEQKRAQYGWIDTILENGAESMLVILPDGLHAAAMDGADLDDETNNKLAFALGSLAQSHGLEYLYTVILTDEQKTKLVLSSPEPQEFISRTFKSNYLLDYPELNAELVPVFDGGKAQYIEYTDRWGEFRSIFRPVKTADGRTFLIAADMDIAKVKNALFTSVVKTAVMLILLFIVCVPLVYLIVKSRKREMQNKLDKLMLDPMTGIKNRHALAGDLKRLTHPQLIIIDLIKFSDINNAYGPAHGDQVIVNFTNHLKQFGHSDLNPHQIYRIQGDEIALVIDQESLPEDIDYVCQDLLDYIAIFNYKISDEDVITLKVHAGAVFNETSDLITLAKIALLTAREQGRSVVVYEKCLPKAAGFQENLRQLTALQNAIDNNRLVAWLQPIFASETNEIICYEALARVADEEGYTHLSPAEFLPVAHRYGLYHHITRTVLHYCIGWLENNDCDININLSIKDIEHPETRRHILRSVKQSGMGSRMSFELLETEAITHMSLIRSFCEQLSGLGSRVGIDDFGKEYSNFDRLMELPIDFIKLDGEIIEKIHRTEEGFDLFEKLVQLAHKKDLSVTAELVSSKECMDIAMRLGCDSLQGYYLGLPAADEYSSV